MADTTFTDGSTRIVAAWLNEINDFYHTLFAASTTASAARTALGLGTMATQAASAVAITGGTITGITDLAVADGGTGSSTAANARTALSAAGSGDVTASAITMSTAKLLGRTTASTGAIEEISVGSGLTFAAGSLSASATAAASQAEQEAGSSTTVFTSPGRQHFHPSAAKVWCKAAGDGTSILASYNMTSITDTGTGAITFTIATDFSSADWSAHLGAGNDGSFARFVFYGTMAAGTLAANHTNSGAGSPVDPTYWTFAGFGDHT